MRCFLCWPRLLILFVVVQCFVLRRVFCYALPAPFCCGCFFLHADEVFLVVFAQFLLLRKPLATSVSGAELEPQHHNL